MARATVSATIAAGLALPLSVAAGAAMAQDDQSWAIFPKPVPTGDVRQRQTASAPLLNAALTCPVFPGDSFSMYIAPEKTNSPIPISAVFAEIVNPTLEVLGFGRPEQIRPPKNLAGSPGVVQPGPDYPRALKQICERSERVRTSEERDVCAVLLDPEHFSPTPQVDRTLRETFGMNYAEMMGDRHAGRTDYVFMQRVFRGDPNCESSPAEGVPIEHTLITASRNPGETVSSVRGTFFDSYWCQNGIGLPIDRAIQRAYENLWRLPGVGRMKDDEPLELTPPDGVELVLLPSGGVPSPSGQVPALYFSYRMLLFADLQIPRMTRVSWRAWVDASNGNLLQLIPQFAAASVKAEGKTWGARAGTLRATREFAVDPAVDGFFTLALDDCDGVSDPDAIPDYSCVMSRLDRCRKCEPADETCGCESQGSFDDGEVAITEGDDPAFANFDVGSIGSGETCLTADSSNRFGQVNAFFHLNRFHEAVVSAGSIPLPFPEAPLKVLIDIPPIRNPFGPVIDNSPFARYDVAPHLNYPVGVGAVRSACESGGAGLANLNLNAAHDPSVLTHELGHIVTKRFRERRVPCDGLTACPEPWASRLLYHDFADAWAADYTGDNCIAGWYARHRFGVNASFNCAKSDETNGLPRSLDPEFDTFPDHRRNFLSDSRGYSDGQIAGAGLWAVREGLRRSMSGFGLALQRARLNSALFDYETGTPSCTTCEGLACSTPCDLDIFRYLRSLAFEMAEEWKTDPNGLVNQVLGGWAKVGVFLTPWECIDEAAGTRDCWFCSSRDTGADAIIDVGNQWKGPRAITADTLIRLARLPEMGTDLGREEQLPYFHIWTGPPYVFDADGHAETNYDQCNSEYEIELSSIDQFPSKATLKYAGHTNVCYATWSPSPQKLVEMATKWADAEKIFYRVKTWKQGADSGDRIDVRISTEPANGFFGTVLPPYIRDG